MKILLSLKSQTPLTEIRMPVTVVNSSTKKSLQLTAIVDTGTSVSAIAARHAEALGLEPVGTMRVNDKDGAQQPTTLCAADLILNGKVGMHARVAVLPIPGDDLLLGMDVLSLCSFQMGQLESGGYGVTIALLQ